MSEIDRFWAEHQLLTRRFLLRAGAGATLATLWHSNATAEPSAELTAAIGRLEPFITSQDDFRDVSRGKPLPHELSHDRKREVGMTRETWKLEIVSDPDHPVDLRAPMSIADGTAFDFSQLLELGKSKASRFAKVMTCLNIGRPLGMGIWEGVPLRDVLWKAEPRQDVRRVFYYGYHNDQPEQMFRSSLPVGRVLEDPQGLPPVILCYKLNGQWLTSERGGPVRVIVPEAYGFKSIKWLSHVVLTNLYHANDTYADGNNDIDSNLKTFATTLTVPQKLRAHQKIPVTGFAQVGPAGLSKVQVFVHREDEPLPKGDKYFVNAPWRDATILAPSTRWPSADDGPMPLHEFDLATGKPKRWPLELVRVHWATLLDGLPTGEYSLRSRSIDANGQAQPMPRPFRKSGHAAIEEVSLVVES